MSEIAAKRIFIASCGFLLSMVGFAYGVAVERYQIWPYSVVHESIRLIRDLREFGEPIPPGRRVPAPAEASRELFTVHEPGRVLPGYYAIVGWDDARQRYAAWLYDHRGERRHTWVFNYDALDPDGPWNGEDHPHPFHLLRDGSVLVAFDSGDVMARLDACSEPVWIKSGIYHHSLSRTDDGSFWTWRGDGTPYGHYHYAENFDADTGDTIREIGLIEDVIAKHNDAAIAFGFRQDFPFRRFERDPVFLAANDMFHPNDVEALSDGLAPLFPMFEAGDLLMSFRTANLVVVIDADEHYVKWSARGPWISQHDPDFTSDGKISVYNNNLGRGRSEIVKIDPATRAVSNELSKGDARFYSEFMGKHQYLPNGNILIAVPGEGRVLEVTADGGNVMEFNNVAARTPGYNDHIENAMWVPADYFDEFPRCVD